MSIQGLIGVAVSTTGDPHRMGFLETCVQHWRQVLPLGSVLVITVDGDDDAVERAARAVYPKGVPNTFGTLWRVGQPLPDNPFQERDGRLGVAVNKNTGLELLMEQKVEHLFLCDDDTWPRSIQALHQHIRLGLPHSMVAWGRHRKPVVKAAWEMQYQYATWTWPRGALLYTQAEVVDQMGGMVEPFGPGGHEHVEWSNRIAAAGFTPHQYVSPAEYANYGGMGAAKFWHAEDMAQVVKGRIEPMGNLKQRRRKLTSVRRQDGDWEHIERIMREMAGSTAFVPYGAEDNGRSSATLYHNS